VMLRALNEFDSKLSGNVDWRQKLEHQPGAVLATEMKNNSSKLARWTAQAVLAAAEELKLGFVSRTQPKDSFHHTILQVQRYSPRVLAATLNISVNNMWATLKSLLDRFQKLEQGRYLVLKDPNGPFLFMYQLPSGALPLPEDAAAASSVAGSSSNAASASAPAAAAATAK